MFGAAYFGSRFFGSRFFGDGGDEEPPPDVGAAAIWNYVLSNGKTAGQTLVENNTLLKIVAAVAAGKSTISNFGGGAAEVVFRNIEDTKNTVVAEMNGSERTSVTLDP